MTSLYDGNGRVDHRIFVKNALVGWKNVKRDAQRLDPFGVTQFGYLSDLGKKLSGEARQVLDNYLEKWEFEISENSNQQDAMDREEDQGLWRGWCETTYI